MPEAVDLRPDWLAEVRRILGKYAPGRAVWAFGSRARGHAKPYSDLDLAILGGSPLPDRLMFDLKEAFDESDLPFAVDVVDWAGASGSFRLRIAAEHTPILDGEE